MGSGVSVQRTPRGYCAAPVPRPPTAGLGRPRAAFCQGGWQGTLREVRPVNFLDRLLPGEFHAAPAVAPIHYGHLLLDRVTVVLRLATGGRP
jgi:hypothetical protein